MKNSRLFYISVVIMSLLIITVPSFVLLYHFSTQGFDLMHGNGGKNISASFTVPEINGYLEDEKYRKPEVSSAGGGYLLDFFVENVKIYGEGHVGTHLVADNRGNDTVYVYSYGLKPVNYRGDMRDYMHETSLYVYTWGDPVYIGYVDLNTSGLKGNITYDVCVGLLVDVGGYDAYNWSDLGVVCPQEVNLTLMEDYMDHGDIKYEKAGFSTNMMVNRYVTPTDPTVRAVIGEVAVDYPGRYNLLQVCALYDWVGMNVYYVDDPRGSDYWTMPTETLESRVGDCEDQSLLLASLIESLGGTAKIYLQEEHMFTGFYAGDNQTMEEIKEALRKRYGVSYISSLSDEYGNWILLDVTCGYYPGDLPCDFIALGDQLYPPSNQTRLEEVYINV